MPLFQKKPMIVELNQFTHPATGPAGVRTEEDGRAYVITIHDQKVYLEPGDWIAPEGDGVHYYPIKDTVKTATYDPVGASNPRQDWRIGLAATPKMRTHPLWRQVGVVRRVFPSIREHLVIEVYQDGEVTGFDEPSDDWMTV